MPEYLALVHHRNAADDEPGDPPSVDEMNDAFLRLAEAGVGTVQ